jgi:hypothetical protein
MDDADNPASAGHPAPIFALYDEYGRFRQERQDWLGVTAREISDGDVSVRWPGSPAVRIRDSKEKGRDPGRIFEVSGNGNVRAWYEPGGTMRPAVVDVIKGDGVVRIVGFQIGKAYTRSVTIYRNRFENGFDQVVGANIVGLANSRGIVRPVVGTAPFPRADTIVELLELQKPGREATVAINYVNGRPLKGFGITIPRRFPCAISMATGRIYPAVPHGNSGSTISVDLGPIDVFAWIDRAVACH